jgi:hypothetical protein
MRWARIAGILAGLLVVAPVAAAAGGGWTSQRPVESGQAGGGAGGLSGVSCSSSSACTAVGSAFDGPPALAERWNGSRWSLQHTPNTGNVKYAAFDGVSCPSLNDCIAVGSGDGASASTPTLAERWDGNTWTVQPTPSPPGYAYLNAVSCSSRTACIAVGESWHGSIIHHALAERWNGSNWAIQRLPKSAVGPELELHGVSCSSASACTAVGAIGGAYNSGRGHILVLRWNGRNWSVQPTAGAEQGVLSGVSCPSDRWCVAVGSKARKGLVERWNGKGWSPQRTPQGVGANAVSCTSRRVCTAVGQNALRWNGRRWSTQQRTANPQYDSIDAVSCPSTSDCTAVGYTLGGSYSFVVIERWTG